MQYAIITDIHANRPALDAVHEQVREMRSAPPYPELPYWCMGDVIGYGPDPVKSLEWLRDTSGIFPPNDPEEVDDANTPKPRWEPGNHDEWLLSPSKFSLEASASLEKHHAVLQEPIYMELGEWFLEEVKAALDREARLADQRHPPSVERHDGLTVVFTHGSTLPGMRRTKYQYVWKPGVVKSDLEHLRSLYGPDSAVALFCGHTHYPMFARLRQDGGVHFESIRYGEPKEIGAGQVCINPGSVGQPRDGDRRAAFVILDTDDRTVTFRRVEYKVEETMARMHERNYPPPLIARLRLAGLKSDIQSFEEVYRRPKWDLRAVKRRSRKK